MAKHSARRPVAGGSWTGDEFRLGSSGVGERRRTAAVLRSLVSGDDAVVDAVARVEDPERFVELLSWHRVLGALHDRLGRAEGVDPGLRLALARGDLETRAAHARVLDALELVAARLDGAGVPWLSVKGPVLAHGVYPSPSLRRAGDLDVLVEPGRLRQAMAVLEEGTGALELDRNWRFSHRVVAGEVHLELPSGMIVDLHWHLLFLAGERDLFRFPTAEVMDRRQVLRVGEIDVPTLEASDTVIHLAYHASKEGADRLGWLVDITRVVEAWPVDWDAVVRRSRAWRLELPVAVALHRAAAAAGADVPREVLRALAPAAWLAGLDAVDRLLPITASARGRDRSPWSRTLDVVPAIVGHASAATPGAWRAARWAGDRFVRDAVEAVAARVRGPRPNPGVVADALATEAGGADDREAFLARVERLTGWE
jgi:hypothetical protein